MRLISVKKYMLAGVAAMLLTGMVGCASNAGTTSTVADAIQEDSKSIETICEDLQSLSMDGVIYYQVNPVEYNEVSTANISFGQVTSIPDQDSKVKVTLPVTITMKGKYTNDCIDYSGCITPSFELFDRYTSVVFPVNTGVGDGNYNYSGAIKSRDKSVDVAYSCDYSFNLSGWNECSDSSLGASHERDIVVNVTYTITMPADYDGLAIKVTPVRNYGTGISTASGSIVYVQDDYPDGTRVFSVK